MTSKVVYVTCGTKGAGHLVRGMALGRALDRAGFGGQMQIISPIQPLPAMASVINAYSPSICAVDSREVLDPDRAAGSALAAAVRESKPDLLVVDLFWAPMLHIRGLVTCDAWLLVRSCPPIWLVGNRNIRFDRSQYQRVIGIESVEHKEIREHISPIVISNPDEAKTREEFCQQFGTDPDKEIVVFSHAGLPGEMAALQAAEGDDLEIVRCDLHEADAVFPLAPWLVNVDRVHCSAGYNTFWESRWLGYAERTTFSVFKRKIDDPAWRVKAHRDAAVVTNGADVLAEMILRG